MTAAGRSEERPPDKKERLRIESPACEAGKESEKPAGKCRTEFEKANGEYRDPLQCLPPGPRRHRGEDEDGAVLDGAAVVGEDQEPGLQPGCREP